MVGKVRACWQPWAVGDVSVLVVVLAPILGLLRRIGK